MIEAYLFGIGIKSVLRPLYGSTGLCINGKTPLMEWMEMIISRVDHYGDHRLSKRPRHVGT